MKLKEGTHFTQKSFPCRQCGASLVFCADENALRCAYCGVTNRVNPPKLPIYEHDLEDALAKLESTPKVNLHAHLVAKCPSCGADFDMDPHLRSTKCPFCTSPVVTNLDIFMPLSPESILPFARNQKEAKKIFKKWVGNLWFAPNSLKKFTETDSKFVGIYLPYWTYDSQTHSNFKGLRGDTYYVEVRRRVNIDGRETYVDDLEARIEWTAVSGTIDRHFDDVLIGATKTIPRKLVDALEPWDLHNLQNFDEAYLSGFESEVYQVALDDGFSYAKEYMSYEIREAIRHRIGGDRQQINEVKIYHDQSSFKYILLPIWTAHFKHHNKSYRFAINARSGIIKGERPYSKTKIFLAILLGLLILGTFFLAAEMDNGLLSERFQQIQIQLEHF
ncbi:MAG: primosomal protein N' (replication factor Y) - superfamily II helicase [Epsilonproteobacteria bacterium]|nr:primosomal protein N' (replication factor Y) - superfamily II helicase [Campylobacterota bacterium]